MVRKVKGDGGASRKGKRTKKRHGKTITANRPCGKSECKKCYGYENNK